MFCANISLYRNRDIAEKEATFVFRGMNQWIDKMAQIYFRLSIIKLYLQIDFTVLLISLFSLVLVLNDLLTKKAAVDFK